MGVHERLILIATSDKWSSDKYSIKEEDVLFLGRCDVREELRKRGGAEGVICQSRYSSLDHVPIWDSFVILAHLDRC